MKNNSWQILRTDLSSYQKTSFLKDEARTLEKCHPDARYVKDVSELDLASPIILITNTHTNLKKIAKPILKQCKLIVHPNSGHDNLPATFHAPIILGNIIRAPIVTEYILSSLLKSFCPIPKDKAWRKDRSWDRDLLREKKVLLIGYGVIGKMVAPILNQMLAEKLAVYDPFIDASKFPEVTFIDKNSCKNFDVVIVCASLTDSSRKLINFNFLKKQNTPLTLINSARGGIIVEKDLIRYLKLKDGVKAQVYLDVFEKEPNDFQQFKSLPQVNCTSHIAGVSKKLNEEIIKFEATVIKDFINSEKEKKS